MRKLRLLLLLLVCLPLALAIGAPAAAQNNVVIGAILFGQDSFFQSIQAGMQAAADAAGVQLLVNIHEHDINKETQFIEDYVARGVNAIVITPESLDASVPALRAAAQAGVKIVCFNTCVNADAQKEFVSAFYETDQASLGYQTGQYLAQWLSDHNVTDVNIGISQCDFVEACQRRGAGFRQALNDAGVHFNEVANQQGYEPDVAQNVGETMLQANPNINILWSENEGGTVGLTLAVQSMGLKGQVHVFGTDISPQLANMLLSDDDILQAVTGQSPGQMGGDAVNAAITVANGGDAAGYHIVPNAFFSRSDPDAIHAYLNGTQAEATPAEATPVATVPNDHLVIGAILFGQDSFFQSIQAGMQAAADAAGVQLLVNIHEHDINKETQFIEDYVARGVNAIVITPESLDASVPALRAAAQAGVKIVCFNTCVNADAQKEFVSAFYETDQASLGYQTGQYLAQWLSDHNVTDVNIGISQCDFVEACQRRGAGFRQALNDAGVHFNEVANQQGYEPDVAQNVGETMLQANPNINILWSENEGGTVGLTLAVQSMGLKGQVHVFGTDISPQLANMLLSDDDILQAVTGQSPGQMGGNAVNAAVTVLRGGDAAGYHIVPNAFFSRADTDAIHAYLDSHPA